MAVQAGVIGQAQVTAPSATLSSSSGGGQGKPGNNPAGWAWFWFIASVLFLVFTHIASKGKG